MEDGLGLRKFCECNSVVPEVYLALVLHHQLTLGYVAQTSPSPKCKRKATDSTSWNSILTLRPLAEQFLKCRINDGVDSRFWFDIWTPFRQLIKYLGDSGPRDIRLPLSASVKDATNKTGWTLPQPRSDNAMVLHIHLTTVQLPLQQSILDSFHWIVQAKDCKGFSSSKTWEAVRPRAEEKVWAKSVWFTGAIPRHAFNTWLANLNRLPTKHDALEPDLRTARPSSYDFPNMGRALVMATSLLCINTFNPKEDSYSIHFLQCLEAA
ncbi:uncharacterized protein LOC106378231 [Brassica napus]|uniref:uncharacterized protein LOC106378231 n=1 Tax=Brassica napus TaxID=3708 RepID=UPI0006AB725A|nr:uncharacterized protein LOC106378231 [Brassica napus]